MRSISRREVLATVAGGATALAGCSRIIGDSEPEPPQLAGIYVDGSDALTMRLDVLVIADGRVKFSNTMTLHNAEDKYFDFTGSNGPDCQVDCSFATRVRDHPEGSSDWQDVKAARGMGSSEGNHNIAGADCYVVEVTANEIPTLDLWKCENFSPDTCSENSECTIHNMTSESSISSTKRSLDKSPLSRGSTLTQCSFKSHLEGLNRPLLSI
jgi:hypothetical protein